MKHVCNISKPKILPIIKLIYRMNHQKWDKNEQEVDSPYHLSVDPYFRAPQVNGVSILIEDSKPDEEPIEYP